MLLQILRQRIVVLGVNQWVFLGFTTWMHGSGVEYRIHQALFMKSRLDVGHKTCLSSQVGPHSSNMICRSRSRFPAAPDAQLLSTTGLRIQIQRWTGFWMLLCSILNVWKFFVGHSTICCGKNCTSPIGSASTCEGSLEV